MRRYALLLLVACSPPTTGGTGGGTAGAGGGTSGTGGGSATGGGSGGGSATAGGSGGSSGGGSAITFIVQDDFESATLDSAKWDISTSTATLTVDTTRAKSGTRSLHALTNSGGGTAMIEFKNPVPFAGQRLWGRMHIFFPTRVSTMFGTHSNLSSAVGTNDLNATAVYATMISLDRIGSLFYQDSPAIDNAALGTTPAIPVNQWFCVEWDYNGVDKMIHTYVDGTLVNMSEQTGLHPPAMATLRTGIEFDIEEAWFDQVAWARQRIGCNP